VRRGRHAVFVDDGFALGRSAVLLDNFPGTAAQLELLGETAALTSARVVLLELHTTTRTLMARVAERLVCLACGPDPHAPAIPAADDLERCVSCRMVLARRDSDVPSLHRLRLARYRANLPEIRDCAARHAIPHLIVNADAGLSKVCDAARKNLHNLIEAAEPEGADHDHDRATYAGAAPRLPCGRRRVRQRPFARLRPRRRAGAGRQDSLRAVPQRLPVHHRGVPTALRAEQARRDAPIPTQPLHPENSAR
jgi:adenylate kinase family enzyme